MIEKTELTSYIRKLDAQHRNDGDGGYLLVDAIRSFSSRLDEPTRATLRDLLVDLVETRVKELWGVALETLAEERIAGTEEMLAKLLKDNLPQDEWTDQLVFALIRLRHSPGRSVYIPYIVESLKAGRHSALILAAALCRIDPESCLAISSEHLTSMLSTKEGLDVVQHYIPAFVSHFVSVDEELLRTLTERIESIDPRAGRRFASSLSEYLAKPFVHDEIGFERAQRLQNRVLAASRLTSV